MFAVTALLLSTFANLNGQEVETVKASAKKTYAIAIHGGAGSSPARFNDKANEARVASIEKALKIGTDILKQGGTALDAVEAVVHFLEDDPQFNAGKGAVFNALGKHELDASIMDGKTRACGAVAGVSTIKNPISLARLVMTETRHVLLATSGAEEFANGFSNVKRVENNYFDTEATLKRWKRTQEKRSKQKTSDEPVLIEVEDTGSYMGTVGCVALDSHGNLAAATSTGGLTNKKFGRVGDSPIVGAGTYADNQTCAVSCTGIGEQFIRNAAAYDVAARMKYQKVSLDDSVNRVLTKSLNPGDGGIIAVDRAGNISMHYTTAGMARAAADSNGRFEVIWVEKKHLNK